MIFSKKEKAMSEFEFAAAVLQEKHDHLSNPNTELAAKLRSTIGLLKYREKMEHMQKAESDGELVLRSDVLKIMERFSNYIEFDNVCDDFEKEVMALRSLESVPLVPLCEWLAHTFKFHGDEGGLDYDQHPALNWYVTISHWWKEEAKKYADQ